MINQFKDNYRFLSNFYPCIVTYNNINFQSVEHAFVAAKSTDINFHLTVQKEIKPGEAKKLGRKIKLRPDWEDIKIPIMHELLRQKFSKNNLRILLNMTGNEYLEEGNTWHDNFWGNCYCKSCKQLTGRNNLGRLLMIVRKHHEM